MSVDENRAVVRHLYEEVINEGNFVLVDELIAPDYVGHEPGQETKGLEGFKEFLGMFRSTLPDLNAVIEDQVAEGDRVVTRYTASGTHQGELMGIEPTGKQVEIPGIEIHRFDEGGKIVEKWNMYDALGMMHQLGVMEQPSA